MALSRINNPSLIPKGTSLTGTTSFGSGALNGLTTGTNNTAVGYQAGYATTTPSNAVSAFGFQAMFSNTTGTGTAVGSNAYRSNTTGTAGTAAGLNALYNNTTGNYNTAVGQEALVSNTTASYNTAVGYQAGYSTTGSQYNTSMGSGALYSHTTGNGANAAFGYNALRLTTTAESVTAVGTNAGYSNTTGSYNSAFGKDALYSNTTASNNTAVGHQAGYTNVLGTNNTFIGYGAGHTSNAASTTGYNTAVGAYAGYGLTTGVKNTFIGSFQSGGTAGAGSAITTGSANSILGAYTGNGSGLDIRTLSNNIVLSDGDGNPWVLVNSGGSMVLGGNGYSYDASPYQATEGFIVGLNDATRYGAIFGCNNIANREAVLFVNPNGAVGSIRTNGSATTFNTSSDYRLKENIAPMTGALAKVAQLKPVTYKWKIDGTDGEGFIAHELAEVCPSAVSGEKDAVDKNGKIKPQGIDVSFLVATLTAAIQELKAEFDAYKAAHP
jgi:hypothetical protein